MSMTDEAMGKLCDAMREQHCAGADFEVALGELVGKYRAAHDARMRDSEAARLLPLGWVVVCERLGVAKSTAYKMHHRAQSTLRRTA